MKKKSLPYVPWYHGDFLRGTPGWTLVERAVYWMLLCAQWETGPLPDDLSRLAAIAGLDTSTMTSLWSVVGKKFSKVRSGRINKRMLEHKNNFIEHRARLSTAGKKGMGKRWNKTNTPGNVIELHGRNKPNE